MRTLILSALFLIFLLPGFSQSGVNTGSGLPEDPGKILAAAAPFYDFSSQELKPWHLKVLYQFYDMKGKPAEEGTWEYWWASPKVHRSSWSRSGAEHTEWSTADGALYRKDSGSPLRYFERTIGQTLFPSLPGRKLIDSGRIKLDLKMLPPNKPELACVLTTLQWVIDGKLQAPRSSVPMYYCFDPATLALRMTYSNQLNTQYNQLVKTQGRYLSRQVIVMVGKQKLFTASVETIEGVDTADAVFSPPSDATSEQKKPGPQGANQGDVTAGSLVKKTQPIYPLTSKIAREQGVVVLGALIGKDGRIHDLEVLASPSQLLAESALDAVKKWEYKPYLLNGEPVEVETVVNVTYNLGN